MLSLLVLKIIYFDIDHILIVSKGLELGKRPSCYLFKDSSMKLFLVKVHMTFKFYKVRAGGPGFSSSEHLLLLQGIWEGSQLPSWFTTICNWFQGKEAIPSSDLCRHRA